MALFSLGSGTNLDDISKIRSYLYRLTEELRYQFQNIDPEENFDERAKLIYAATQERQASLEVSVDGIKASYQSMKDDIEASIQLAVDGIYQRYATKDTVSELQLTVDGISATYVTKTGVAAAINLNEQGVKIKGDKITLEGTVTANTYFKINTDGSMEAVNGKFSGAITVGGNNNTSGSITVKNASGATIGTWNKDGISVSAGSLNGASVVLGGNNNASGTITVKNAAGATIGTWNKDGISVTSGSINGASVVLGGSNNVSGAITVKNASGTTIGTWDKDGLSVSSGSITGGTITGTSISGGTISGTSISGGSININNKFGVDSNGNLTANGSLVTQGSGDNPKFLYLSEGSLTGGRGAFTNQSGIIAFDEYVVLNNTTVPAMRIASDALLLGGQVFTTTEARQGGTMNVYMGRSITIQHILTNLDIEGGDLYWDSVDMVFVNGILVGSQSIHHWDEDEYDPGPG